MPSKKSELPATRKERIFAVLNNPQHATKLGKVFAYTLAILIALNALLIFVVFDHRINDSVRSYLYLFDMVCTVIFLIEYIARIWTADLSYPHLGPLRARVRYIFSFMGIIDLLAVAPYIGVALGLLPYQTLNTTRVLRVIRLIKITRYVKGLNIISRVINNRKQEIIPAFAVLMVLTIAASVLMYQAENPVQPEAFDSIFTGMYWAITTITSTGYGDLVPITPAGRIIGFLTMVCSIGIVAIPAGIFTAGFIDEAHAEREEKAERTRKIQEQQNTSTKLEPSACELPAYHETSTELEAETREGSTAIRYCPYCGKKIHP